VASVAAKSLTDGADNQPAPTSCEPPPAAGPAANSEDTPRPRELTVRALAAGCAIGALLAAGNVYTGLKTAFIDSGMITASLLSFALFAPWRGRSRTRFGPLENNVAQTAAASAAVMTFVHGLMGPIPALGLLGHGTAHPVALWVWGLALAVLGVAVGVLFRRKLIERDALPFPTGAATAALIQAAHHHTGSAARRMRMLAAAAVIAGACTWLRDGRPALIPQVFPLPGAIAGAAAAAFTLGLAPSPLMAATGMFIGLRNALTMGIGGVLVWGGLAPLVHRAGWAPEAGYGPLVSWLIWPALGMLLGSTLAPLLWTGPALVRALARTIRDIRSTVDDAEPGSAPHRGRPRSLLPLVAALGVVLAIAALLLTGWRAFGLSPLLCGAALVVALFMAVVCARAAGETDLAPVGPVGILTQMVSAGAGPAASILASGITAGTATQTSQTLWAFKAGAALGASRRAQVVAQLVGALAGSLVVVPVYLLLVATFVPGSETMPAPAALTVKASAQALASGLSQLPPHAAEAAGIGATLGLVLTALARTRASRFLPSATALGMAFIAPAFLSAAALVGAVALAIVRRLRPTLADHDVSALAAGGLAGEALTGVLVALLGALGVLG
jgi:putative OPT family oligopeptide transporter